MDPNKCLPKELTIESVDQLIHSFGLTVDSTQRYRKRKLFFNPIIIFSFVSLFIIKEVVIISLDEKNDLIFKMLGSIGHLMGVRQHLGLSVILASILSLSFQIIYYKNYRNGIKPTFLRVFQVIWGLVPPISLGLNNVKQIKKLTKITTYQLQLFYHQFS